VVIAYSVGFSFILGTLEFLVEITYGIPLLIKVENMSSSLFRLYTSSLRNLTSKDEMRVNENIEKQIIPNNLTSLLVNKNPKTRRTCV